MCIWWSARVSSRSGEVLSVHDWVSDVNSFNIYPIGVNDPSGTPPSPHLSLFSSPLSFPLTDKPIRWRENRCPQPRHHYCQPLGMERSRIKCLLHNHWQQRISTPPLFLSSPPLSLTFVTYAQANPSGSSIGWLNFPRPSGGQNNDYNFPINFTAVCSLVLFPPSPPYYFIFIYYFIMCSSFCSNQPPT